MGITKPGGTLRVLKRVTSKRKVPILRKLTLKANRGSQKVELPDGVYVVKSGNLRVISSPDTRKPLSEQLTLKPGEKLAGSKLDATLSQIATRSAGVLGSQEHALDWLKSHPVPALGGQTPAKLVADGWGRAVLNYLDEMRYGSRG